MSTITEAKKQEYLAEIRGWDWILIFGEAAKDQHPDPDGEEGATIGYTYLGTVFSLTPSGKVYMPFACSNVDPCPHCKEGTVENPSANREIELGIQRHEYELRKYCMETFGPFYEGRWPAQMSVALNLIQEAREGFVERLPCEHCDALGSEEARWDELFHEALNEVAEANGGFIDQSDENYYFAVCGVDPNFNNEGDENVIG